MSNHKKIFIALTTLIVLLCVVLIFGAKQVVGSLSGKSNNLVSLQIQQQKLNNEQNDLANAKKEITKYKPLADLTKSIVPQDKNQAEVVREVVNLASANGITLSQVSFPQSDLSTPTTANSNLNLSQLTQVKGLTGVYQLPIIIQATNPVNYGQFINFLSSLEHNRRTAQVTNITLTPNTKNPSQLSFTISINDYIKP